MRNFGLTVNLVTGALCCYAQNAVSSGTLGGVIRDSSGAVMPGVAISVTDESTGIRSTTKSNASGIYVFPELAPSIYQAQFNLSQFKTTQIDGLKISAGQTTNGDVTRHTETPIDPHTSLCSETFHHGIVLINFFRRSKN